MEEREKLAKKVRWIGNCILIADTGLIITTAITRSTHFLGYETFWQKHKQRSIFLNSLLTHLLALEVIWNKLKQLSIFLKTKFADLQYELLWDAFKHPSIVFNNLITYLLGYKLIRNKPKQASIFLNSLLTYLSTLEVILNLFYHLQKIYVK